MTKSVLVEGWRGINHSYAIVNQHQLLEMIDRDDIEVFHRDLPFQSSWNPVKNATGLNAGQSAKASRVRPFTNEPIDITYRIAFPYRLYGADSEKVFCFATTEYQTLNSFVYQGPENQAKYANDAVKIITPSNWSRTGFLLNGFNDADVIVIPHGVDLATFRPLGSDVRAATRAALAFGADDFVFLTVGSMTWNKGIDKLMFAFAHIRRIYPFAKLILKDQSGLYGINASALVAKLEREVPSVFTADIVASIGVISNNLTLDQLSTLYNACDCYVSPYRAEGFGLTPLEAAACGAPVILTGGGATDDYFHESFVVKIDGKKTTNDKGNFIEPDLESLITAMSDVIEKRARALNPDRARQFIEQNFSWKTVTDRLVKVFLS